LRRSKGIKKLQADKNSFDGATDAIAEFTVVDPQE
jgi:hypothetical protein